MATQKEQLTQQIKDTYEKGIASGKTREEVIGAMKNQLQTTGQYDTAKQIITGTPAPLTQTQDQLKAKIATGNFSASEARQYNQMTGSNTGARDIALTSQQGVQNLQTTVTPEETAKIAQAGISDVGAGVKPDLQGGTKEDFKQATQNVIEKNILQTPETTGIKGITDLAKTQTVEEWKKRTGGGMSNLENWVESKYGTIATQENGKLTAIIGDKKYQWILDDAGNPIKTEVQLTQAEKYKQSILNKYANAGVDTLYNAFVNGQIPSDMQGDLMGNPNFTLAKEKYDKKLSTDATNNQMENVYNTMTGKEITVVNKGQELNNKLVDLLTGMGKTETDLVSFRDYMAQNYPDLVTQTTDLNAKNKRLKELSEIANKNLRDIEAKYPGLTKGSAILLANKQNEVINDEMRTLQFDIAELSSNIQFQTNQANQDYNYMQEQQARKDALLREQRGMAFDYLQGEQQYQRGLEAEQRQRQFQLQDIQAQREYQTEADKRNFEQQKEMLQLQQDYQNANIQTDIVQVGNKNVLINKKTGETIKSFDLPTAKTKPEGPIKMGEDSLYDPVTQTWITKPTATSGLGDLRNLASQFPGQAWAKNNNPAGITWNANFDAGTGTAALLKEAGINFSKGTSRPASEGGNYVTFDTIEDGLKAQRIIMTQTYGNSTVEQMLGKWVGTGEALNYAKQVAGNAGVNLKAKVSSLSDDQISQLQMAKIQKESPGLYGILTTKQESPGINKNALGLYRAYMEDNKLPSKDALKGLGMTSEQFINNASEGYNQFLVDKAKEISSTYPTLNIEFTPSYSSISATQREKLNESLTKIGDIDQRLQKLKDLFGKVGTEVWPSKERSEMETLRKQIILKAKEVENLGVLNGPDLGILEDLLPSTTGFVSGMFSWDKNTKAKLDSIQSGYRSDAKTKGINYGAKISFKNEGQKLDTTGTSTQYKANNGKVYEIKINP